jgi:hypothetical protein
MMEAAGDGEEFDMNGRRRRHHRDDSDFSDSDEDDRLSDELDSEYDSRVSDEDLYSSGIDDFRKSGKENNGYRK